MCQSIAGSSVDAAVGTLIVQQMTPTAVELALDVRAEIEARHLEADQLRSRAVERAQAEADLAQRRFMLVDPNNRLVADTLEGEWNDKLRVLANARAEREQARERDQFCLDKAVRERLVAMTVDFHKLWTDPDTPNRERKRLIAHIIEDVTLVKLPAEGTTKAHVRFKGGKLETLTISSPKSAAQQVKTQPGIIQLVDRLLDDHIYSEIAELLNQQGHKPGEAALRGRSDARFTAKRVAYLVHQYNLRSRYDRLRERGMLTKQEAATRLGFDPDGEIADLLDRRDTWSGRTVLWPVSGTDLAAPVDLAALPVYNRDRVFEGFRGFGVVRMDDAVTRARGDDALPHSEADEEQEAPAEPGSQEGTDPFQSEVPVISIADRLNRRISDKIIRLAEHRPPQPPRAVERQLSPGERNAFEEIRERLRRETASEAEDAAESPPAAETAAQDETDGRFAGTSGDPAFLSRDEAAPENDGEAYDESAEANEAPADDFDAETEASSELSSDETEEPVASSPTEEEQRPVVDAELISGLPLPLLVHAGDTLHFANQEFLDLTGYASLEQIRREGGLDRLFADDAPDGAAGTTEPRLRLRTLGGEVFPVDAHLQSIGWQDGTALLLAVRRADLAPPQQPATAAEPAATGGDTRELERHLLELRTIIDTATDGVVLIAPDGTIRNISRPAEALFGFDSATVEGKPFATLFAIESQKSARDYLAGLADNGVASVLNDGREVIGREAEGRFIPLFMTIGKLPEDSGYCAVVRDITQFKRAEEELTQARAQAERASSQKTEFLARVSHEIRTPLNAIIGFSELMMDEKFGPIGSDRYRDYLRDINRSGNHVLDLVNDLLDISKIEAGEQEMNYEAVSLNEALSEVVAMMQPQANRERVIIRSSLASRLPDVVADLRSVRQIALNLLSNAIRYTQAGGQVIVSTAYELSGDVALRVRDTGIGMSLAEIDQALKPFKQINALKRGRQDGTGLGLPLTKAMVEANRARFAISSTPGEGTLVEIVFPSTRVLAE